MVDQCVRLGLAVVVIAMISLMLYQFSGRANAVEPVIGAAGDTNSTQALA